MGKLKDLLDNFTKQFMQWGKSVIIIIKKRKEKKSKPKWMNGEIKTLIRETKKVYHIQKTNLTEENQQRFRRLFHIKKEEIRKRKILCELELTNSIKDNMQTFKYFRSNKKQKSSIKIGPLHEERKNITRY